MKTIITTLTIVLLILSSCNKEYIIKTKPHEEAIEFEVQYGLNYSYYKPNKYKFNGTIGEVNKQTGSWLTSIPTDVSNTNIEILLGGNTVGNYADTKENITIRFDWKEYHPYGDTNSLNATIIKYDEIGGIIEGSFNGNAISIDNNDTTYVSFENGKFKVIRDF
jgi:hypothetical protein